MVKDSTAAAVGFFAVLLGFLLGMVFAAAFSDAECQSLEERLGVNLAYSFSVGCVPVEDL